MKYYAIIVAGGKGNRMNNAVAKQFLILDGRPVLMHTLEAFHRCVLNPEIILVLNIHQQQYWEELCRIYKFDIPHKLVKGGQERFDSVKNGLKIITGNGLVAIHDAVRPLVSTTLIAQSFEMAAAQGNAIAAIQPVDSVRRKTNGPTTEAINRDELFLIQTPQTFQTGQLKKAYLQPYRNEFTDDASVVERAGFPINILPGERGNIKITYPEDMDMASFLLKKGF
jgi:2-C-methyl-D-erythritol 4-phosphate cytidylyltransferase